MENIGSPHQDAFDAQYITSGEIVSRLGVGRTTVRYARARGLLPPPIEVGGLKTSIWLRSEVESYLAAWELMLNTRRRLG